MTAIIDVDQLGKRYLITHKAVADLSDRTRGRDSTEEFWALRDITFQVKPGDRVGLIGRNGAGKSTLLKVLSRITSPSEGRIVIRGRVASLLEVGTGFHPELTGRENIFLNGAILGMSKAEIRRKFDEIVAFSEVEQFLDTPVKRYSSGMYVRLAFAVAVHLDSEILIIDEVLSVGDALFQKKCLDKLDEVGRSGRTIFFVSHNASSIMASCNLGIVLHQGRLVFSGDAENSVRFHMDMGIAAAKQGDLSFYRPDGFEAYITSAFTADTEGREVAVYEVGADIVIEMEFNAGARPALSDPVMGVTLHHAVRGTVGAANTRMTGYSAPGGPFGRGRMRCRISNLELVQGQYSADIWLGDGLRDLDALSNFLMFEVVDVGVDALSRSQTPDVGLVRLNADWSMLP